ARATSARAPPRRPGPGRGPGRRARPRRPGRPGPAPAAAGGRTRGRQRPARRGAPGRPARAAGARRPRRSAAAPPVGRRTRPCPAPASCRRRPRTAPAARSRPRAPRAPPGPPERRCQPCPCARRWRAFPAPETEAGRVFARPAELERRVVRDGGQRLTGGGSTYGLSSCDSITAAAPTATPLMMPMAPRSAAPAPAPVLANALPAPAAAATQVAGTLCTPAARSGCVQPFGYTRVAWLPSVSITRLPAGSVVPEWAVLNSPPVLTMALPISTRSVAGASWANAGAASSRPDARARDRMRGVFMGILSCAGGARGMMQCVRDYAPGDAGATFSAGSPVLSARCERSVSARSATYRRRARGLAVASPATAGGGGDGRHAGRDADDGAGARAGAGGAGAAGADRVDAHLAQCDLAGAVIAEGGAAALGHQHPVAWLDHLARLGLDEFGTGADQHGAALDAEGDARGGFNGRADLRGGRARCQQAQGGHGGTEGKCRREPSS